MTPEQQKAIALANARKRMAEAQSATVPAVPGKPFVQEPERGLLEKAGRGVVDALASRPVGLTARHLIKGTTLLPGMAIDAVQTIGNKITGSDAPVFSQNVDNALNAYLPKPENSAERVVGDVAESIVGTGGVAGVAENIGAKIGVPAAKNFLARNLGAQVVSSAGSSGASSTAREMGASVPAQVAAGLVGGFAVPPYRAASAPKAPRQHSTDVRQSARNLYKEAEQAGGEITPQTVDRFLDGVSGLKMRETSIGAPPPTNDLSARLQDWLGGFRGKQMTLNDATIIDQHLTESLSDPSMLNMGRPTAEGLRLTKIRDSLRDMIDDLTPENVVGGTAGFDATKAARAEWSKAASLETVESIIEKAMMMDVPASGIRSGFRTLYNNKNRLRGFSDAEKAAIKKAAETGLLTGSLKLIGSRLVPISAGASVFVSPSTAMIAGAGATASYAARNAATKMQQNKANAILDLISQRGAGKNVDAGTNMLNMLLSKAQGTAVGTSRGVNTNR